MTTTISCDQCGGDFKIPDSLFVARFAGKVTTIKCKKCGGRILVDGSRLSKPPAKSTPSVRPRRRSVAPKRASLPPLAPAPISAAAVLDSAVTSMPAQSSASLRAVEVPRPIGAEPVAANPGSQSGEVETLDSTRGCADAPARATSRQRRRSSSLASGIAVMGLALVAVAGWRARATSDAPGVENDATLSVAPTPAPVAAAAANPSGPLEPPLSVAPIAATPAASADLAVPAYDTKALALSLDYALRHAEDCHRGGRPAGTAHVTLRFGPSGKVRSATLEGEPIASAAVSKCILAFLRSALIPAYEGEEFVVERDVTLR